MEKQMTWSVEVCPVASIGFPWVGTRNGNPKQASAPGAQTFRGSCKRLELIGHVLERVVEHDEIKIPLVDPVECRAPDMKPRWKCEVFLNERVDAEQLIETC